MQNYVDVQYVMLGVILNCHNFHERTQHTLGWRGSRALYVF